MLDVPCHNKESQPADLLDLDASEKVEEPAGLPTHFQPQSPILDGLMEEDDPELAAAIAASLE